MSIFVKVGQSARCFAWLSKYKRQKETIMANNTSLESIQESTTRKESFGRGGELREGADGEERRPVGYVVHPSQASCFPESALSLVLPLSFSLLGYILHNLEALWSTTLLSQFTESLSARSSHLPCPAGEISRGRVASFVEVYHTDRLCLI